MSLLDLRRRPVVSFNPDSKEHRRYYAQYLEDGNWRRCPYQFVVEGYTGLNTVAAIQTCLAEYYLEREFKFKRPNKWNM